jgi:hypothetical protein
MYPLNLPSLKMEVLAAQLDMLENIRSIFFFLMGRTEVAWVTYTTRLIASYRICI